MTENGAANDAVVIERMLDAPVELVWRMWTEPEHFAAWYGPDGATIDVRDVDRDLGQRRVPFGHAHLRR